MASKNHLLPLATLLIALSAQGYESPHIPSIGTLSLDEKIGQLLMVATQSAPELNRTKKQVEGYNLSHTYIEQMIRAHHIGGVLFLGAGTPQQQIAVTKRLQTLSKHPLLIGLDAEWGLAMRHVKDVITFPRAAILGALSSDYDDLVYDTGKEIGLHCKAIGVHINFAPVADVNSNPLNPIINTRSFASRPEMVSHKATLFMKGMQAAGILACAKHFPGHGDTAFDSHTTFGTVHHSKERLEKIELPPFQALINEGVDAVMTAHLAVPALEKNGCIPATTSHAIVTDLLRNRLQFNGLVFTDGLGMKGISDTYDSGEVAVLALCAGVDMLLCPVDVEQTAKAIKRAVKEGTLSEQDLDTKVARILAAKRRAITCNTPEYERAAIETERGYRLLARFNEATALESLHFDPE